MDPNAVELIERLEGLLQFLIPLFEREPRSYLTIAIGCTGGRHRSVAVAGANSLSTGRKNRSSLK